MSTNPEAFGAMRRAAYAFVNDNGKDAEGLKRACEAVIRHRRERLGSLDMTEAEANKMVADVVDWTVRKYNSPRWKPKRSRSERALAYLAAPELFEMSGEIHGKATIRNAARLSDQSKSTMGRHLLRQGIAPRRTSKIKRLSRPAQKLAGILDATSNWRAAGIVKLDMLGDALWEGRNYREVPKTTRASRTKKLKALIQEINAANIGYNNIVWNGLCGIMRGHRAKSQSEAITWVEEQARIGVYSSIVFPSVDKNRKVQFFWADPIVIDVMALIDMGNSGHFFPLERLDALFRFERPLLDMTPVLPWIVRAHNSFSSDPMCENLGNLADMITDPVVRKATRKLAKTMFELDRYMGSTPLCADAFLTVDHALGVMERVAETAPESYARLAYIYDWFLSTGDYYDDVKEQLGRMLDLEKSGEWIAPDHETLSQFMPIVNADGELPENEVS